MTFWQDLCGFWKILKGMEIENTIFQDLENLEKRGDFQNGYGEVLSFCLEKWM